ncbi:MAG: hypothetical protein LKI58_00155 [Actinomyces sp.]|jgi:hypothetical protein|nr:hypothetical protein [Actinomyces sp.]MCI1641514.1 hypothetical protein [Actinomyces sp.]MCI1661742.1 hypothetical protein [Actinomyces sp.]MCI1690490.1 hypothetical protein [Actinomyces sp.]MCI1786471.1 hypothetical protein [Actinomyces sp.]MCI1830008.1 hypothetical protein [Actinomyces sp.]
MARASDTKDAAAGASQRLRRSRSSLAEIALRGQERRAPDGRKLTKAERASVLAVARINAPAGLAAADVARAARSPDVGWMIQQFHNPLLMARRRTPILPERGLLDRAVVFLENAFEAERRDRRADASRAQPLPPPRSRAARAPGTARTAPRRRLARAIDAWYRAMEERRGDPAWREVEGTPVSLGQFRAWQEALAAGPDLAVVPGLEVPAEFVRALEMVQQWDEILEQRGHVGERFSLREEVVRLHNWPGDQWDSGDDYAAAQRRFHRRLGKARRLARDPVRDRIMMRALYLREGLLLNPVDDLEWFLAVLKFRQAYPESLEVRPELMSWRVLDRISRVGRAAPVWHADVGEDGVGRIDAADPRGVAPDALTAVGGPGVMIDLDEDVVTALPPGCRVRRLVVSARGPLGPDWIVYWVESEWGDSRPILDLVESEKLHPRVVFVSDGQPEELAGLIRPFLSDAFEIPTNPLTAHSHNPGVVPRIPDHPDAGLS